jgi:predicted aspartyl protease
MRTLLLAATALIGVSAAAANPATLSGRYFVDTCTTGPETWTLAFDQKDGHAELSLDGHPDNDLWGVYTPAATTLTAVVGDAKSPMNLAMVDLGDHSELTWVHGTASGKMACHAASVSDVKPAVWHDTIEQVAPVAAIINSVPLTFDNNGAKIAVSLGTMPVTMIIDTGAMSLTVTQAVADWLVTNHQATANAQNDKYTLADGKVQEFKSIDIDTLNVGGHELHKVHANIVTDATAMLLALPFLAQLSPKVSFDFQNAKLMFN